MENQIISLRGSDLRDDFKLLSENKEKIDEIFEEHAKEENIAKIYIDELLFYKIED